MSDSKTSNFTLEQRLLRLQEIQKLLESGGINLTESTELFDEASALKIEIEAELAVIKNKITEIENRNVDQNDNPVNSTGN